MSEKTLKENWPTGDRCYIITLRDFVGRHQDLFRILRDPNDAASAYQLALLYQKTGAIKRAEELFAKVGKARAEDPARSAPRNLVKIIRDSSQ